MGQKVSREHSKREKSQENLRKKLKANGHTCVRVGESFPSQTFWCGEEKCTGISK